MGTKCRPLSFLAIGRMSQMLRFLIASCNYSHFAISQLRHQGVRSSSAELSDAFATLSVRTVVFHGTMTLASFQPSRNISIPVQTSRPASLFSRFEISFDCF
jgi:hypothetical protein